MTELHMIAELDDKFWERFLKRMESHSVIPVIGPGAITFGGDDKLLHPWLAQKLAETCHLEFPVALGNLQQVVDAERDRSKDQEEKNARLVSIHLDVFKLLNGSDVHPSGCGRHVGGHFGGDIYCWRNLSESPWKRDGT